MLFASLVLSLILLLLASLAFYQPKWHMDWAFYACGSVFAFCPVGLGVILPPVVLQFCLLAIALVIGCSGTRGRRYFPALAALATLVPFAVTGACAWHTQRNYDRLREQYPLQSMEERVPVPRPGLHAATLPEPTAQRLAQIEKDIECRDGGAGRYRATMLRRLHEQTVMLFVNSPGFGIARIMEPTERNVRSGLEQDPPVPQPGTPAWLLLSPGDLERESGPADGGPFEEMHQVGVVEFASPEGFGYFRDRRHVAGFEPHRFQAAPRPPERWRLETVDLVGLLVHDGPVVYVSAHLPRMDELREAPTRPPDAFESVGLADLRRGNDLFVREAGNSLRLLGAVRAARQCTACHGCERGDLLGAFSYTLSREAQQSDGKKPGHP
jgi:hypothetical protein